MTLYHLPRSGFGKKDERHVLAVFEAPSEEGNELIAVDGVNKALQPFNLPEPLLSRLSTAVAETTMNAMEHGNHYRADQPVKIYVLTGEHEICVRIIDHGGKKVIPPSELPDLDAKLAGLQSPRGWGLFLARNMVDEMEEYSEGEFHTVELVVKWKKEEAE